jgi:hypothetical protein
MDKRCARCRAVKPPSAFYRNAGWKDGFHPYCKACLLAYQGARRFAKLDAANPERRQWTRRHIVQDYFHVIDNARKAYLLGLLAADGSVLETPPRVSLELAIRDRELVELFRDEVAPAVRTRRRPRRLRNGQDSVLVAVTSAQLAADLGKWGVVPRKSWTYRWPTHLPEEMKRPYLLGHFDGDGFITISRRGRDRVYGRWGLLGTRAFLESVMDFLCENVGIARRRPYEKIGVCTLNISGRDAERVDAWLRDGLDLGLERKTLSRLLDAA